MPSKLERQMSSFTPITQPRFDLHLITMRLFLDKVSMVGSDYLSCDKLIITQMMHIGRGGSKRKSRSKNTILLINVKPCGLNVLNKVNV